jgi:hypothetical protein
MLDAKGGVTRRPRKAIPIATRNAVYKRDAYTCGICGLVGQGESHSEKIKGFEIDHIKPLSAGGLDHILNLQLLCKECHYDKTNEEQANGEHVQHSKTYSSFNNATEAIFESPLTQSLAFIETVNEYEKEEDDEYVLNGVKPTCNCGCGVVPKFLTITNGYREYVRGHSSRINNNWGHNIEAIRKSHETQKKMYESGELTIWNKGLTIDDPRVKDNIDKVMSNPNRGKNISKKLSGVFKSEKHKEKLSKIAKKRWSNPEERKKQRERKVVWIKKNGFNKQSKLEKSFEGLLINLGINFEPQYPVNGYLYDFYIKTYT